MDDRENHTLSSGTSPSPSIWQCPPPPPPPGQNIIWHNQNIFFHKKNHLKNNCLSVALFASKSFWLMEGEKNIICINLHYHVEIAEQVQF